MKPRQDALYLERLVDLDSVLDGLTAGDRGSMYAILVGAMAGQVPDSSWDAVMSVARAEHARLRDTARGCTDHDQDA